jgi:hypothetical protein
MALFCMLSEDASRKHVQQITNEKDDEDGAKTDTESATRPPALVAVVTTTSTEEQKENDYKENHGMMIRCGAVGV